MHVRPHNDELPSDVAPLLASAFRDEGEELFLVGGALRDRFLGYQDLDHDFATSAPPQKTVSILSRLGIGSIYRVGEKFGTIGLAHTGRVTEITTYRSKETYEPGSRQPDVQFGRSIEQDLSRRDFTINAIAQDPLSDRIIDPLGGRRDLELKVIRAVGDARERFREDPLRLLRGVRFAARLGFTIEETTWEALRECGPSLTTIAVERIRDELTRMLLDPKPSRALVLLRDANLLVSSVPELLELEEMRDHGPRHPLSLWDHTMRVVDAVPEVTATRWAALLHDVAKPTTRTVDETGRPRFFRHEEIGAERARAVLKRLRYDNRTIDAVEMLVGGHMQLHGYESCWSDGAVRRLVLRFGEHLEQAIQLARADAAGHVLSGNSDNEPKFAALEARLRELNESQVHHLKSPLSGHDLMNRYERPPGPWIERIKSRLMHELIEGTLEVGDRDSAWVIADQTLAGDLHKHPDQAAT